MEKRDVGQIEIIHLRKCFGRLEALRGINLTLKRGEFFGLLGPNGAGKTTLIKVLASLILPENGRVKIYGLDALEEPEKVRSWVSLAFGDERSFYWRLTGRQNLEFFSALYNLTQKAARERIEQAALLFDLHDLDKLYQNHSTGMRQRLALARSFLSDARLLLMDEPTRSLDPLAAAKLRDLIRDGLMKDGRTVFFTTHNTEEAEKIADRIAIIDQGSIRACGTLTELRTLIGDPLASLEEIMQRLILPENLYVV